MIRLGIFAVPISIALVMAVDAMRDPASLTPNAKRVWTILAASAMSCLAFVAWSLLPPVVSVTAKQQWRAGQTVAMAIDFHKIRGDCCPIRPIHGQVVRKDGRVFDATLGFFNVTPGVGCRPTGQQSAGTWAFSYDREAEPVAATRATVRFDCGTYFSYTQTLGTWPVQGVAQ